MRNIRKTSLFLLCLALFMTSCAGRENVTENAAPPSGSYSTGGGEYQNGTFVFVENSTGIDDGIARLISSMQSYGIDLYQTPSSPDGLIAQDDVVILKINCQWADRGGTNTDLIRSTIQALLDHPLGFRGEIIVADNGQAQFGSENSGGSLEWRNNNAVDRSQSVMHVVRDFQASGHNVTGVLWDRFTTTRVSEFNAGDNRDGFIVEDFMHTTGTDVSYPKFTTEYGTHVSFKYGIWNPNTSSFNSEKLKVINMPVLKAHFIFQVTGAVKAYMGIPSARLTNMRPHNAVGTGSMGTLLAETRMPVLNIIDMIWIAPSGGPMVPDAAAVQTNKIAASVDPFALDYWTTKNILMPAAERLPGGRAAIMNPDGTTPGTFGYWLKLSINEVHKAGISATMNEEDIILVEGGVLKS